MSDTYNKLQYGNNYKHWKILDLALDLKPHTLTWTLNTKPYGQFSQCIWYAEFYSVHAHMAWNKKFRKSKISLDTGAGAGVKIKVSTW